MSLSKPTSTKIRISPSNTGLWRITQSDEAASCAAVLLEKDLNLHHVFLNSLGFHDHMPHHILALFGTGANAAQIQKAFDLRHELQKPVQPLHDGVLADLEASWASAAPFLGDEKYYPDFLAYFQAQIEEHGYEWVLREYLFKGDAAADDLLVRLHSSVLHPLIQLMYGLEWEQPAIVAEALAQTCVHQGEGLDQLLLESERRANNVANAPVAQDPTDHMPALSTMFERVRADRRFDGATKFTDKSKVVDGILTRVKEPMLSVLEQVRVHDDELEERTAEMIHTINLVASAAAIRPPYHVKYDFFLVHHVNSALIYLTMLNLPWLTREEKRRFLEWKIRMDLIEYVARGRTPLGLDHVRSYQPKVPSGGQSVRDIGNRLQSFGDDGHGIKQARAIALGHEFMKQWQDKPWAILKDDDVWRKIQHMAVDALEGPGNLYVRSAGFDEAWKDMPLATAPRRPENELQVLQTGSGSSAQALAST
ncbi:uncharacterized protein LMH87_007858 [Akanthomyces muscarius]|uniref:HypA protein n=1 Tax=Akanthomyces muscarius TaxID=2231603 RepID=A0A9W8QMH0_AKAMU|nr:uncharacterized protein LMH87_007858 [Akanthomyces muscarius]KAJ4159922.1 hypothetical protein LMH87_007858 [Akanthomyces muscarius]